MYINAYYTHVLTSLHKTCVADRFAANLKHLSPFYPLFLADKACLFANFRLQLRVCNCSSRYETMNYLEVKRVFK